MIKKKLLILGHGRMGKDTLAEMLRDKFGFHHKSSSQAAADIFIYEALREKYSYDSAIECYRDRHNHREEWFDLIYAYNELDGTRLAREILKGVSIYVGMRSLKELEACKEANLFDLIIGVYNTRIPEESKKSFNIDIWDHCHVVIPNNGTLIEFSEKVDKLAPLFYCKHPLDVAKRELGTQTIISS